MSMFNDIVWNTNDENSVSNAEKVKITHWYSLKDIGHGLGPGSEEEKYGSSNHVQEGQWNCTAANMVQRCKETGHLVFKSISSLSRGILKQKKGKTSIHFNGDSMNTELLFQTFESVNQRSVHGAVTDWCYQFGSTEEEKGWASTSVDNKILTKLKPQEEQLLVSPPIRAIGNRMQERVLGFDELAGKIQLTQSCEKKKLISYILMQPGNSTKFDQMGTDGEHLHLSAENTRFLDTILKPKLWQLFLKAQSLDWFWKFKLWKFIADMELKLRFHLLQSQRTHLTLLYQEKQSVLWMKFMITKKSSGSVMNCSPNFKDQ